MEQRNKLTKKEEEVMQLFWSNGAMFVREMLELYPEPRPHFNTVSTMVRDLEKRGFVAHHTYGGTYQYYAVVSEEEFRKASLHLVVNKYYEKSPIHVVSTLVKDEVISVDELKSLIAMIESKED